MSLSGMAGRLLGPYPNGDAAPSRRRTRFVGALRCRAVFPIKDYNPTRRRAFATLLLIVVCVVIYFFVQPGGQATIARRGQSENVQRADVEFTFSHAAIPCEVIRDRPLTEDDLITGECQSRPIGQEIFPRKSIYLAVLYSMFLHGSLLHIAGNMVFLWVFGNNIEDRFGRVLYLGFYLLAGVVATFAHVLADPGSVVPVVGASGAIAGVMGVYLVLFPSVKIKSLIFIPPIILWPDIKAKWLLGFWLVSQFFISPGSGVAWVAHVGGFLFGVVVGLFARAVTPRPQLPNPYSY
jgi:membrane associated rhomboid family serine protease